MKFKIDSGWMFVVVLLIALTMPVILEVAEDYTNLLIQAQPSYIAWFEWSIVHILKSLASVLGWLTLFFFAGSFFGYRFKMETVDDLNKQKLKKEINNENS